MAFNKNLTLVLLKTSEGKFLFKPFGYHKFLLAVFGFFLNGSSGLLIGFIIGCFFDGQFVPKTQQPKAVDQRLNFLMLAAFIIQTIGLQNSFSDSTLSSRLVTQFGEPYIQNRLNFFRELLRQRIQVEAICDHVRVEAKREDKINLIEFLFAISSHPQIDTIKLRRSINYVAAHIELEEEKVQQLFEQFYNKKRESTYTNYTSQTSNKKTNIYSVFNLTSDCTEKQLKKAYHILAKKYHPDSNPHASLADQKIMQEKLRVVIEKYEMIKEQRGWK